jgi:hypothetical protein
MEAVPLINPIEHGHMLSMLKTALPACLAAALSPISSKIKTVKLILISLRTLPL